MRIKILAVGKVKEKYVQAGIEDYVKRLKRYLPFEVVETKEEREPKNPSQKDLEDLKQKEAAHLLGKIRDTDFVIALDGQGKNLDSPGFARLLQQAFDGGSAQIVLVIGGSNGLHKTLLERANRILAFSKMTFPHQLFRLMLCEQCYRAQTILKGQKYHK